jgi:hypothetical protein
MQSSDGVPAEWKTWCEQCQHDNQVGAQFCEACGVPLDDWEFDLLHAPALHKARKWMGAVALMYLAGALFSTFFFFEEAPETAVGIAVGGVVLGGTQAGLWWWAKRATFPAAVASLALYVIINLLNAVDDPGTLVRGWLIKILFVSALWKAIQAGLTVKRMQAQAVAQRAKPA